MRTSTVPLMLFFGAAAPAAAAALLWSMNTLSGLFGGPTAELRHALAAIVVLAVVRTAVARSRRGSRVCFRRD